MFTQSRAKRQKFRPNMLHSNQNDSQNTVALTRQIKHSQRRASNVSVAMLNL